jgi:hypothetical protein
MDAVEIDRIFAQLRTAGHGTIIKLALNDTGQPVEAIIFEPSPQRPAGFEDGIFAMVPSNGNKVYYLDPIASKEQGQLIVHLMGTKEQASASPPSLESVLKEFEYLKRAPDVKQGGGVTGEARAKAKGIIDLG